MIEAGSSRGTWRRQSSGSGVVPGHLLTVEGEPAEVKLLDADPRAGDCWEVPVRAFEPYSKSELEAPFAVSRQVSARQGRAGFELVGSTGRRRFDLMAFPEWSVR